MTKKLIDSNQILSQKIKIKLIFIGKKVEYLFQFEIRSLKSWLVQINKTKFYFVKLIINSMLKKYF
jgi:hypothetical protein